MSDALLILRLSGDFYTKARKTRLRFHRRLGENIEAALNAFRIPTAGEDLEPAVRRDAGPGGSVRGAVARLRPAVRLPGRRPGRGRAWRTWSPRGSISSPRASAARASPCARPGGETASGSASTPSASRAPWARPAGRGGAARVNLDEPESTAYVEIEPGNVHLFQEKFPSSGGLPVGVEGRALALVSGGFDSAVASWLMLKRGVAARLRVLQPRRRRPPAGRAQGDEGDRRPLELRLQAHSSTRSTSQPIAEELRAKTPARSTGRSCSSA